jgi:hypothetical protein
MYGSIGSQAASSYNQGLQQAAVNQPREIGILQRVDGLRSGLEGLRCQLADFIDRVSGSPSGGSNAQSTAPVGIVNGLAEAEEHFRACLLFVAQLNDKF